MSPGANCLTFLNVTLPSFTQEQSYLDLAWDKVVIMSSNVEKEGVAPGEGIIERLDHGQEDWWEENFMRFSLHYFPNGHATQKGE